MRQRTILTAAAAPAAAILVFGVIYGSVARPLMGAGSAMLSSLFVFSGAVQFTIAALLSAGAGAGALVPGSVTLNLRNVVLGAVVRPRIDRGPVRRAGLALASGADAARTLLTAGTTFYLTWQAGTVRDSWERRWTASEPPRWPCFRFCSSVLPPWHVRRGRWPCGQ